MKTLIENIKQHIDTRQSLSQIRKAIKEPVYKNQALMLLQDDSDLFDSLLKDSDAKTRKNASLLMGDLELSNLSSIIFDAYMVEETLFVKSSYLTALKNMNYIPYIPQLKEIYEELSKITVDESNSKHINEEMNLISELIISEEGIDIHEFTGYTEHHEIILLANKLHKDITEEQITSGDIIPFKAGVRVSTDNLYDILPIRTYNELLYIIPDVKTCPSHPVEAAHLLASSTLLDIIGDDHKGIPPYYFRVELKSKMPVDKKSNFIKKFYTELEKVSNRKLINSKTNYEFEIRLIENKSGEFNVLLKLYTIPDNRFKYRKYNVSQSIKPFEAATLVRLAAPYMIEDACVLDPFCGVGTMLIERQKLIKGNTAYGLDILEEAITKAKKNTALANQIIHYINRDFFTFSHEHLFDEIFTNMPFTLRADKTETIEDIYENFFKTARTFLKPDGRIILYSHDCNLVNRYAATYNYNIITNFTILEKAGTGLYIIEM